jgi:hypothetical protein
MRLSTPSFLLSVLALFLTSTARADILEGDVRLTVESGRLMTGLISEDGLTVTPGVRVFYGELGLDVPNAGEDPGFKAEPGTFAPGVAIGFGFNRALRVWNGTDFSSIMGSMTMSFATESFTTPSSDTFVAGFSIPVDANGEFHHHPFFTLNAPAADGIYLIDISLTGTGLAGADPIWMLWNQNMDTATAEAAYDYATTTIPAPAGFAVASVGAASLLRRRR